MSGRFYTGRRQPIEKISAMGRLHAAVRAEVELLEQRQLLNAQVVPDTGPFAPSGNTPLPPLPGVTAYVNGQGTSNPWQWDSAITPNTVNDLVLNVTAYAQSYTGCCEGTNDAPGNTGSINAGRLLTNGLTQNQVGGFPATGAVPATGSGSNSDASSGASVVSQTGSGWWLEYNLGTAPGQATSSNGYDLTAIDVITGGQGPHTGMQVDLLVQFVGANATDWFSLSDGNNFSFTTPGPGSAQMAIQSPGGPMAFAVRSMKFLAVNNQSYFRELVVTGVPSSSFEELLTVPAAPVATADPAPGKIDVVFAPVIHAKDYQIQRALVTGGVAGPFSAIAGLVTTDNPTTYVDSTAVAGSVYVYRIVAHGFSASPTSGISNQVSTPVNGAGAHFYNMAYWEGPAVANQLVDTVRLNWPTGSAGAGIRNSVNSAVITGKVTPTESGTYTFYSNTDDDGYLYMNGVLVSSDVGLHSPENAGTRLDINNVPIGFAKPVQLTAGTSYNFVLLENNTSGSAAENLVWKTPDGVTQVVPSAFLTPASDTPIAPANLAITSANANFVNFTFTAENNAVVHYILQRAVPGTVNWTTVDQIDPGSDIFTNGSDLSTAAPRLLTIQDAQPLTGGSYLYQVSAVNFDGVATSQSVAVTVPVFSGTNVPGVEIHAYNLELFRRTALAQPLEASAVAQNGLATEYIAQRTNQTYLNGPYAGPIDRDYSEIPPGSPAFAPSSPDPTAFPDIQRIHTESFSQAFTGVLTPGVSGVYTIITNTDDDGYAWIDGTLVSADPGVHGQQDTLFPTALYPNQPTRAQDTLVPVYLTAGQSYDLTMLMGNTGDNSGAHLKWVEPAPVGSTNSGQVLFSSNADVSGATLSFNDPTNSLVNLNYNNYTVFITAGPGAGQAGYISNYNIATKLMTVDVATNGNQSLWSTLPTSASRFMVAWVAAIPLQGHDAYPVSSVGGLQLHEDPPFQGIWSPVDGSVTVNTSASAAQNLIITKLSFSAGITLTWSDQGLSELWYEVQRSTDNASWTTIGTTPMNVGTTFTDTAVTNAYNSAAISYFYRIRGVNFDGAGPFSIVVSTNTSKAIPLDTITGTAGVDQITLMRDEDGVHIDWTINGAPQIYQVPISSPNGLTINGLGSNDIILFEDANRTTLPSKLTLNGTFTLMGLVTTGNPLFTRTIDIGTSTVFINYTGPASDPISQFRSYLQTGFNGGAWNGTSVGSAITSSAAAANFVAGNATTGIGYADSADGLVNLPANTIELKYTLYGDTGLTGSVGFTDFMRMTQHFTQATGATWGSGDFNYDGSVNAADFNLLQPNYGQSMPALAVAPPTPSGRPSRSIYLPPTVSSTTATSAAAVVVADPIPTVPLIAESSRKSRHPGKKPARLGRR